MLRIPRDQLTYEFSASSTPVARIKPGTRFVVETHDTSSGRVHRAEDMPGFVKVRDPRKVNPAAGPLYIEGAEPGDDLVVTIEEIRLLPYGFVRVIAGAGVLQDDIAQDGVLNWTLEKLGLPTIGVSYSVWAMWIVFSYIWLPFMILPVFSALERIPESLLEASADLGARGFRTFRKVVLPLALPGVVAGSIFTFSLTLGDYITPTLVGGGPGSQLIGNVVYDNFQKNLPLATAYAVVPLVIVALYLLGARRTGAFEEL